MADKRFFIDIFEEMIAKIQAVYDTVNDPVEVPYGLYGRKSEVIKVLSEKDTDDVFMFKKYPLIILYRDLIEPKGGSFIYESIVSPTISIVTDSDKDFKTTDRYEQTVKPKLFPLYQLLLQEIADNPDFWQSDPGEIIHTIKVWDGNPNTTEGGILYNDYLDGIDIKFTDLKVFKQILCEE